MVYVVTYTVLVVRVEEVVFFSHFIPEFSVEEIMDLEPFNFKHGRLAWASWQLYILISNQYTHSEPNVIWIIQSNLAMHNLVISQFDVPMMSDYSKVSISDRFIFLNIIVTNTA